MYIGVDLCFGGLVRSEIQAYNQPSPLLVFHAGSLVCPVKRVWPGDVITAAGQRHERLSGVLQQAGQTGACRSGVPGYFPGEDPQSLPLKKDT